MITDEDKAKVGQLAMNVIDNLAEESGDEVTLGDVLIVVELDWPTHTSTRWKGTSERPIVTVGMAQMVVTGASAGSGYFQEESDDDAG